MTQFSSTIDLPCAGVLHSVTIAQPGSKGDTLFPVTDTAAAIIAAHSIHAPENDDEPGEAPIMPQPRIAQALTAVDQRRLPAIECGSLCSTCGQNTLCSSCGQCHYCEDIDLPCASIQRRPTATLFLGNVTALCNDIKARSAIDTLARCEHAASHYSSEDPATTVQMTIRSLCIYDMEPVGRPTWEEDQEDEEEPEQQDRGNEPSKIAEVSAARYRGLIEQRGGAFVSPVLDEGGNNTGWLNSSQCPIWPQDDDGSGQRRALLPSFPYKPRSGGAAALLVQTSAQEEATR